MTTLEARLYFTSPCLPLRDIRIALNLAAHYGTREGFLDIILSQSKTFDNFDAIFVVLKDFYGQAEPKKEIPKAQTVNQSLEEEKRFKGATFTEKQNILKIKKKLQGRYI